MKNPSTLRYSTKIYSLFIYNTCDAQLKVFFQSLRRP
ncbi:hypothetical protein T4B_3228 [Trichinella pseudospiralis]|uniref:Uncharacterized protein n=1 Tax=Trichinella pseudospiralis TaxID=6337 RepID=A0A0V1GRV1_TRIPS|nr:hypothetical protein T4B_3228 [Trichinella pseudospiralis]